MKNNNHGFTLVELLAVIAILGIVVSITIFVGINAVNKAKEKSYKTTINNIERMAGTYLEENGDRLFYISKNDGSNIEYQCITIENLIDGGYFKNDVLNSQVSKDDKVKESDYVYLERNGITKSVVKNVYVLNGEDNGVCPSAVKAESDISFLVNPLEWSKTKEITITYKLKNANNINDYGYEYSYSNDKIELISDDGNLKKVKVLDNGTLTGIIKYLGEESYSKDLKIDKIDNIGPVISLGDNKSGYVREKAEINLKVSDFGIGVDNNSFTKDDVIVKVEDKEISQDNLTLTVDNNGSVKLVVNNKVLDGNVNVQIKAGGVLDKLGNSNDGVAFDTGIIFDNTAPSKPDIKNPSGGEWTNKNIKLDLSTTENGSGVNYWQYTYNESASSTGTNSSTNWVTYSNSSNINYTTGEFSQERNQLVYVRVCDKVGNCSDKSSTYIRIDKTVPTKPGISNPSNGNWINSDVKLGLSTTENGSGVESWQYSYNSSASSVGTNSSTSWVKYNNSSSVSYTTDAIRQEKEHLIYVRVCDKAGNCSDRNSTYVRIDKTAPSKPNISNPSNGEWTNSNFKLGLSTTENGSGVESWQYTYNSSASSVGSNHNTNWVKYSNSSNVSYTTGEFSQERNQLVYVRSCDKAGNCSDKSSTYIRIDKTIPSGTVSLSYNSSNKILTATGNVSDALSGFTGVYEWNISTSSTCNSTVSNFTSSNQLTVKNGGIYYACARVKDNAGNIAYIRSTSVEANLSVNIKIYGAINDNIKIYNSSDNLGTVSTNNSGALNGTFSIKPGTWYFESTITGYKKTVTVSNSTTEVGVYPNNSYFWYGNGNDYGESLYKNSGGFTASKYGTFYCNAGLGCDYTDNGKECLGNNYSTSLRSLYMMANAQSRSGYNLTISSVNGPPSGKKAHIGYKIAIKQKWFSNGSYYYCEYSANFNGKSFTSCSANESNSNATTSNTGRFYFSFSPNIADYSCLWVYAIWYE